MIAKPFEIDLTYRGAERIVVDGVDLCKGHAVERIELVSHAGEIPRLIVTFLAPDGGTVRALGDVQQHTVEHQIPERHS